jgi:hypothetical protein
MLGCLKACAQQIWAIRQGGVNGGRDSERQRQEQHDTDRRRDNRCMLVTLTDSRAHGHHALLGLAPA